MRLMFYISIILLILVLLIALITKACTASISADDTKDLSSYSCAELSNMLDREWYKLMPNQKWSNHWPENIQQELRIIIIQTELQRRGCGARYR